MLFAPCLPSGGSVALAAFSNEGMDITDLALLAYETLMYWFCCDKQLLSENSMAHSNGR